MRTLSAVLLAAVAVSAFGGYTYYFTDPMQSLQTSYWVSSGSPQFTNSYGYWGGYGGSSGGYSAMVSTVAVPDGTSSYAVRATVRFTNPNSIAGITSLLLHANTTFATGSAQGMPTNAYIVQFYCNPYGSQVSISKIVNGVVTTLTSSPYLYCSDGMTVRASITDIGQIYVFINDAYLIQAYDTSVPSGAPGIVLPGNNLQNSLVSQVQLGPADRIAPGPIPTNGITYSVYPNHIDFQWQPIPDDPNGTGIALYDFLRDNQWAYDTTGFSWSDTTVQPGTEYSYTFIVLDYFFNSVSMTINITVPPLPNAPPTPSDGHRIGVRPTGAYWGAAPEQIDLLSGNVNFTVPILKAVSRTGWGAGFNLNYNSQNWRQDSGGIWNLGEDVGYGYGWRLMAGSITPIWADQYTFSYYSFTDATGAQYRLDRQSGSVWSSAESIYVSFDSASSKLYFRDGSYWVMGCTSATSEADSGTMYPTTMEDTNGNQIFITYKPGAGLGGSNSSARISQIQDVRALYTFSYNSDSPNHLTSISNNVGTAESYTFSYSPFTLAAPFSPYTTYGTVSLMNNIYFNTTGQQYLFNDDNSGTLSVAVLPNGGALQWVFQNTTYGNGATYRQLSSRGLSKDGINWTTYPFGYYPPGYDTQLYTYIVDPGGTGMKAWYFSQSGANTGMVTTQQGLQFPSQVVLTQNDFTWSQDNNGNLYISSTLTTLDQGKSYQAQKKTDQVVDVNGNVTKVLQYDYNSLTTPARIYTYTYLNSSAYTQRHINNRMTQATLSTGAFGLVTLATNTYDAGSFSAAPPNVTNWDTSYASVTARGDVTSYTSINDVGSASYDQTGNVTNAARNGVTTQVTNSSSTNYAAPSQLSVGSLTSSIDYNSFLGITSATGPNGDGSSMSYDSSARPSQSTSPYGAVTLYSYSNSPSTTLALINYAFNPRWTKTILDGLGRTLTVQSGTATGCSGVGTNCASYTTLSQTDTVYDSCACSPIGKMVKQSLPHAPGATPAWTVYNYDGIGRTLSVVAPDGASTTTYSYQGNTVTVTDPTGKWKTFTMDAFGHLTQVVEPNPAGGANYVTTYSYDAWDNVSNVSMPRPSGTQTRTFTYNGKLLQSATNPENGTVAYTYNSYNKVATKTDAKGQAVVYTYDTYTRLTKVQRYPTGTSNAEDTCQQENYYYDSNNDPNYSNPYVAGRLTAIQYSGPATSVAFGTYTCAASFLETYGYKQDGSRTNKGLLISQTFTAQDQNSNTVTGTGSATLESSYAYDNEGRMTGVTYPGSTDRGGNPQPGQTIGYGFDGMGRLNSMTNGSITGATYDPANRLLTLSAGSVFETRTYNVMGQLTQISYPGSLNITYNYSSTQNNGKITSQTDVSGEQVVYAYDALNRLVSAAATNNSWGQSYAYDGFGNLTDQTVTAGTAPSLHVVYDGAHNRQSGDCADANGNIGGGSCRTYGYDVENRLSAVSPGSYGVLPVMAYGYAPGNKRVLRLGWSYDYTNSVVTMTTNEITFWSVTGQKLATFNLTGNAFQNNNGTETYSLTAQISAQNAYFGGRLVSNNRGNVVPDRLGSVGRFYPWGQEKPSATTNGTEKFTGYFRDSETGLDYANARYHQPGMGRFMTADPYLNSAGPTDPGSWNRYSYVRGDPANRIDLTGLDDDGEIVECDDPSCEGEGYQNSDDTIGGGTGTSNLTSSQVVGYDSEGNPIIGDPNTSTTVNVNDNGSTISITFGSSACPAGQVRMNDGSCDVPIYGINGQGQQVLIGVYNATSQLNNPCTAVLFYGISAIPAVFTTGDAVAVVAWATARGVPASAILKWLYTTNPTGIARGIQRGASAVQSACDWLARSQ